MKKAIIAAALLALFSVEAQAQGRIFGMQAELKGPPPGSVPPYGQPEGEGDALIVEFDPLDGSTINSFPPPVPAGFGPDGLAFDGTTLWFVSSGLGQEGAGTLYALDPDDGSVLDTLAINGGSGAFDGLAALNGLIYVLDYGQGDIVVFDPTLETVVDTLDINGTNPGVSIIGGLGAIDQPDALLATGIVQSEGSTSDLFEIDPSTGEVVDSFPLDRSFTGGVATLGQTIYAADSDVDTVTLYDREGGVIDIFNGTGPFYALGGDPTRVFGIPTASTLGLALLTLALVGSGLLLLRRRLGAG